ncbi:hypothetical protein QJS04_geneDACA019201 [Acorus gramineus]|uniref:E2F-associated phosphoprotein n=1 Tax=Acorus gramineus TaxID=55184 RepID=A0AAV8ZZI3_ACOGR|nr:hypothetical protein QJS04_geneDACA019201 [Acorus gramineus]
MESDETQTESLNLDATTDAEGIISDDDEIDYSIEPEFYDPEIDEKDEVWVHKRRGGGTSDAVLSCPACFTTLCLDCQRHEKYLTQYRAMFVVNCRIKTDQAAREQKQNSVRRTDNTHCNVTKTVGGRDAVPRSVCCLVCSTEVGVFDEDEVYHFFNVLPSEA